ncbi:MAG: hypothetical protein ACE37F_02530 [Nannocystaceae bacterium]|nr:hypothetical protein [bacterium]
MSLLLKRWLLLAAALSGGCDDAQYGDAVPQDMLGRAVSVTILSSDNEAAAIPGTTAVYRFLSNTRVFGQGHNTLATQSWTYTRDGGNEATMKLDYGERSFEEYSLQFVDPEGGLCSFHFEAGYIGPTPSGDPNEVREFNGSCEFRLDTSCADLAQAECDASSACRWDGEDPALPVCIPEPVTPMGDCGTYDGPAEQPQRDAQCKAAWAAMCGGVNPKAYCDIFHHDSWGEPRSCEYCPG